MNGRKKIILAGGSGFLGSRLSADLAGAGYDVVILTRNPGIPSGNIRHVFWDGKSLGAWARELEEAMAVVNLAGKNVNCRYTPENKAEILSSRVDSVHALGQAFRECRNPPKTWVQTSSLAIYGNPGDRICTEETPQAERFPSSVCIEWEKALTQSALPQTRLVLLRIGFVLDHGRGALAMLEKLVRWFLGGQVGNGCQYISWIHWKDMNRMFRWGIEKEVVSGVYNATSPHPVRNAEFMRELRRAMHRPWSPPAPSVAARLGALLLGTEASLALEGRRCVPEKFLRHGFLFEFPHLRAALEELERTPA